MARRRRVELAFRQRIVDLATVHGWLVYYVRDARTVSIKGFPDLVMLNPFRRVLAFVELKTPKGKLTPEQEVWMEGIRKVMTLQTHVITTDELEHMQKIILGEPLDGDKDTPTD